MQSLTIRFARFGWNQQPFTERTFLRICREEHIRLIEYPLAVSPGFYFVCGGQRFITVDSRTSGRERLYIVLHELAHHFLHVPRNKATVQFFRLRPDTKQEYEAEVFAVVAMIPATELFHLTDLPQSEWEQGITPEMVQFRQRVFMLYGI